MSKPSSLSANVYTSLSGFGFFTFSIEVIMSKQEKSNLPIKAFLILFMFFRDVDVIKPSLIFLLEQRSIISVTPSLGNKLSDKNFSKYSSFFE